MRQHAPHYLPMLFRIRCVLVSAQFPAPIHHPSFKSLLEHAICDVVLRNQSIAPSCALQVILGHRCSKVPGPVRAESDDVGEVGGTVIALGHVVVPWFIVTKNTAVGKYSEDAVKDCVR